MVLLLVLGLLSDHSFELLLDFKQVRHLQHKPHSSIVAESIVHAHQRVLVHILLYSTSLIDFFLGVFFVDVFDVVPHIGLEGSHIVMSGQVFNGNGEILGLDYCFSDFRISFQLHCSQVLKQEKHDKRGSYISYDNDKCDDFLLHVYFIH